MRARAVLVYSTAEGKEPFTDWLNSLRDREASHRIRARIERVARGDFGDVRSVGNGVCELRCHYGPGFRVYFGQDGDTLVVLLVGGDKSTQARDIAEAKKHWADYKGEKA